MSDLAHITVVGRVTKDAELRDVNGTSVLKARLATKPYGCDESMFFDVDLWGKRGEALARGGGTSSRASRSWSWAG